MDAVSAERIFQSYSERDNHGLVQKKAQQAKERAAANEEARLKAEARIAAALKSNRDMMIKRREDFDVRQSQNEERRR